MTARLPDIPTLLQAGIDPRTGLPTRVGALSAKKEDSLKQLRILDEQNAVNRYVWYNLPSGLTGQLLERILYYKGQGAFFYMKENEQFYFLPYALSGTIDVYGRFTGITPLPFNGNSQTNEKGKVTPWISGLVKYPQYDFIKYDLENLDSPSNNNIYDNSCVLLNDYTKQLSETIIPRQLVQDPLLNIMSECIPLSLTNLIANSGVKGVRVQDEDQAKSVKEASITIHQSALRGEVFVPMVGQQDFQDLTFSQGLRTADYLLFLQALDNYRLSLYGLEAGGLFQKKAHMLEAEQEVNQGHARLTYQDGLTIRKMFCDIVNSIWFLGIDVQPSESVLDVDLNGDGIAVDKEEIQQPQPAEESKQESQEEAQ